MINDIHRLNGFNTPKLPKFKGHVKLTLHNCRTGKNEVIEGDNIVTNAVRDMLAANYLGAVDYSQLLPIWSKWFSGVLVSEQEHTLNADNYYPKADSVNHIWGHAGTDSIDPNHDDDLTRGNPVTAAFVYGENTLKQVWEWGTTRANVPDGRYIRSLALTHGDVGNAGLGSNYYAFQNLYPWEIIDTRGAQFLTNLIKGQVFAQFDDSHGLGFAIGENDEWGYNHQAFETNKLTVYIRKMPFSKFGLYQKQFALIDYQVRFTLTLPFNLYGMPCFYFDQTAKRLWIFTNFTSASAYSKTVIKYAIIDCVGKTVLSNGTITSDTENLAPLGYGDNTNYHGEGRSVFSGIGFDGAYFYFPTGNNTGTGDYKERLTGYQKINFSNQADQSTISLSSGTIDHFWSPMVGDGLLVGPDFVANGNSMYKCANPLGNRPYANMFSMTASQPNRPSSYITGIDNLLWTNTGEYSWGYKWIAANKFVNTTLFNLPTPVQKTGSQSMTIEYTLTEVEENE